MKKILKAFSQNKGFTLIEMLIVVAIIGMLAVASTQNVGQAVAKARDTRRKADVKAISDAFEMYYQDNGSYPALGDPNSQQGVDWLGNNLKKYIGKAPLDPTNTGAYYYQLVSSWGQTYLIYVHLENPLDKDLATSQACPWLDGTGCWGPDGYWYKISGL